MKRQLTTQNLSFSRMFNPGMFFLVILGILILTSCSTETPRSSADYIKEFSLPAVLPSGDTLELLEAPYVNNEDTTIYIYVEQKNYAALDTLIAPKILLWDNVATVEPASGSAVNLLDPTLRFTVTAEDPLYSRSYKVEVDSTAPTKYTFNDWHVFISPKNGSSYYVSDYVGWTSGNAGIAIALAGIPGRDYRNPLSYPTQKTDSGYVGSAVKMVTVEGGKVFGLRDVPLWSGNFLFGNFDATLAISDELRATKVGRRYLKQPDSLVGWYKYRQGDSVFTDNGVKDPAQSDSCNIYATIYRSDVGSTGDTILAVLDAEVSPLRYSEARLTGCTDTPENAENKGFKRFSIPFHKVEGGEDALDFVNHKYKLAMSFSASKKGGSIDPQGIKHYAGKIGSILIVDEVEVKNASEP
jgi:hypothetical protein